MSWLQVHISASDSKAALLEIILENLGAVSVTYSDSGDEPVLEPDLGTTPLWSGTTVVALFSADTEPSSISDALTAAGIEPDNIRTEVLEDRDWEREWMTHFKPMQFGKRLWIVPSWTEAPDPSAVNLFLDPGLAFGTGTHPTTALCLEWLEQNIDPGSQVLDYGCGSGVLSIAASLLGAGSVVATDIDPQALDATLDNAQRNGVSNCERYLPGDLPKGSADITIANILAGPLQLLAPELAQRTRAGGKLALSGILQEQAEGICERYRQWFDLNLSQVQEDWVLITGTRLGDISENALHSKES